MKIASAFLLGAALALPAASEQVDRVVLRVNDRIATLDEYRARRDARVDAIAASTDLGADERHKLTADSGRATMKEIFDELLMLSRAQQLHLEATDDEIQRAVDSARKRFGIQSDEQFAQALAQSGTTLEEFRQRMANNILFNEVMQREVTPKVKVDDEEVARYWREHSKDFEVAEQRHVEEAVVPGESAPVAEQIRAAVAGGQTIALAVEKLGVKDKVLVLDHDWIERGTLDPSLEKIAWALADGEVSAPAAGRGGLHVLHLLGVRPASVKPLDTVREEITGRMRDEQFDRRSQELLDDLASQAYVVEHLPAEATGYRSAVVGDRDPVRALLRGGSSKGAKSAPGGEAKSAPTGEPAANSAAPSPAPPPAPPPQP